MRTAHYIVSLLIILLGFAHCGFTFLNFDRFNMDALWFFGTGVAIVLAGCLNIAMLRDGGRDTVTWLMALLTNTAFLSMFVIALFVLPEPQVVIGILLFGFAAYCTFVFDKNS